jgi:RNA polymerase sigma-70 factor (ECF subfamily)
MSIRSDEALVQELRPIHAGAAFSELYERHERLLLLYFRRRVSSAELAADLTAETFARALASRSRFKSRGEGSALAWLFGIGRNVLVSSVRDGKVEDRARRSLGVAAIAMDDEQLEAVDRLAADFAAEEVLATLPADQQSAVRARVLEERRYVEIAAELTCSEAVVRKRVSRGLTALRHQLEGSHGNS